MKANNNVLHLTVGEPVSASLARASATMKAARQECINDCEHLIEWMAIEKDECGLVFAPYDEIVVNMKLPERRAA